MTPIDWTIVICINGAIVLYGLWLARGTRRSVDWFLAARGLPWWIVGLSMFATAVDSGDYVAELGAAYHFGITKLTTWWLGLPLGWFLVAYLMIGPLYRRGMFTNAEYLEYRFGPTARVFSAFIQIQYRTNVLGNIAYSLYLTFSVLTDWGESSWWVVISIALGAALYTAAGGLKSVAVTDAMQSVVMFLASLTLWAVVWNAAGGWSGLESRLEAIDPELVETMMHVGGRTSEGVPAVLMVFGWVVILSGYCVVNHSQTMRMLAARSLRDLKIAALAASVMTALVMWFNISLGVMGRGLLPGLATADEIFPRLVQEYLGPGLVGLVVAGLLAGGISTYDSIGSSLAAVLTRDVYARFLVKDRDDRHYLRVSRFVTVAVIALSFAYIPFLKEGMVIFYIRLTSVAVTPLFTIYLMGTLTRVHRKSGVVGLVVGICYGLCSFLGDELQWPLPFWWLNQWWAYLWSVGLTSSAMVLVSLLWGWERREIFDGGEDAAAESRRDVETTTNWLETTRREAARTGPIEPEVKVAWFRNPWFWSCVFLAVIAYINLVVLW